jgi:hypothetical protein
MTASSMDRNHEQDNTDLYLSFIYFRGCSVSGALAPRCLRRRVWDDGASCLGGECGSLSK